MNPTDPQDKDHKLMLNPLSAEFGVRTLEGMRSLIHDTLPDFKLVRAYFVWMDVVLNNLHILLRNLIYILHPKTRFEVGGRWIHSKLPPAQLSPNLELPSIFSLRLYVFAGRAVLFEAWRGGIRSFRGTYQGTLRRLFPHFLEFVAYLCRLFCCKSYFFPFRVAQKGEAVHLFSRPSSPCLLPAFLSFAQVVRAEECLPR